MACMTLGTFFSQSLYFLIFKWGNLYDSWLVGNHHNSVYDLPALARHVIGVWCISRRIVDY